MIRESLSIVADAMPLAAVHCSRERRFLWVNPCYARWVARAVDGIVGRRIVDVVGKEAMRWILNLSDSRHSLLDIAERSDPL